MKRLLFFAISIILLIPFVSVSQNWVGMMHDPDANFYETREAFNNYWQGKTIEKGKGYKQFKRWEQFMAPRVNVQGKIPDRSIAWKEWEIIKNSMDSRSTSGNWELLGPTSIPSNGLGYPATGIGRINCITFDPNNSNIIWVGAPSGGLWKTTDGGTTWSTTTDDLPNLGISSIAIDPGNTQVMYIATGDADASDTYSYGILKSTDGGATWNTTGLSYNVNQYYLVNKIIIDPSNSSVLLATTNAGIYRSTNGGTSWSNEKTGNFKDIEFKPGNSTIAYAALYSSSGTAKVYRSTDNGASWTAVTSNLPSSDAIRIELAVTSANASVVYAVIGNNDSGLKGVYKSTDSGVTWSLACSTPNILSGESDGSGTGGQAWYDLCIAASPSDANTVFVGGVNIWKSTNGGSSFSLNAHWTASGAPLVHADHHAMEFISGTSTVFSGNDGGISKSTNGGSTWTDLSAGLQITMFYRLGSSVTNQNIVYGGAQDNGTNRYSSSAWTKVIGGDGMECIVDYSNSNIVYGSIYYGDIYRSSNGGSSFSQVAGDGVNGINEAGAWITPFVIHPTSNQTLYAGYIDVWKTTNSGSSWSKISSNLTSGAELNSLAVAKSDANYIYAATYNKIFKTTNGGSAWSNISTGLPVSSLNLTSIAVSPTDPSTLWVTFSGYTSGSKVYQSTNGGSTWTNISTGLPNLPANCIVYEEGSDGGVYVGTDVGVYYRDNSMSSWQAFMTGLPNVIINELEIHYGSSKIRAATYGRGLWESDLYTTTDPPASYCTPTMSNSYNGDYISNVTFGSINNSSSNASALPFEDFSSMESQVAAGDPVSLSVTGVSSNTNSYYLKVFIDWNKNNSFDDVGESTSIGPLTASSSGSTFIGSVTTSSSQDTGDYRMRILYYRGSSSTSTSCEVSYGEYEDYTINIKASYCTPIMANAYDSEHISNVTFGTINNTSAEAANTPYEDFSAISASFSPGTSPSISVVGKTNYADSYTLKVYVDWNNNSVFTDNGETYSIGTKTSSGGSVSFTGSISIPSNQAQGSYRMRVFYYYNASTIAESCEVQYGEYEDYTVNIVSSVSYDAGPSALVSPSGSFCSDSQKSIGVSVKNYGASTIDLSTKNIAVTVIATNPSSAQQIFNSTLNTGSMASNATTSVTLTSAYDMSASGNYTFQVSTSMSGDGNSTNNTLSTQTITVNAEDNSSFSYASNSYCNNASNPSPTISGLTGGTFTATTGLTINSTSGQITLSSSTVGGPYTVTYTSNGSCPTSSTFDVSVAAADVATFSYSSSSYCKDGSDPTPTISGTAGGAFTSSPAGLSINSGTGVVDLSASTAGTYTVTYTTTGSCSASSGKSVVIKSNPATPTITQSGDTLYSSSSTGNQWYSGSGIISGATSSYYAPSQSGDYYVVVTSNGCSSSASSTISFTLSGVNQIESNNSFVISPNPSTGLITIKGSNLIEANRIVICNMIGEEILEISIDPVSAIDKAIDLSEFKAGIYLVKISGGMQDYLQKIILE